MQHGIPAHIAESARCLFRECMRRADYVGNQNGNKEVLKSLVREQFRRNMYETNPQKIEEQKQAAARALFNHMYYEASRMASEQAEGDLINESLLGLPKPARGMTLQDEDNKASS
ncbi:hypothetical protein M758_10G042400 [Ceratodon purpureus]|uniref:Complex 1 LYR protein domain-containing protein n=1 Tax=Ceratodon purpureus TaxID=3225 RepID=A0A8T0GKF4_CERPU|nr:hypothetical protein KC19_10G045200 [Ceratodon purpureus]KAG0602805.1 hypothetical protein M758_10G042400 [Ceratodon purpureus]